MCVFSLYQIPVFFEKKVCVQLDLWLCDDELYSFIEFPFFMCVSSLTYDYTMTNYIHLLNSHFLCVFVQLNYDEICSLSLEKDSEMSLRILLSLRQLISASKIKSK